jgi:hypothetical protein
MTENPRVFSDYTLTWTHRHDPKQNGKLTVSAVNVVDACEEARKIVCRDRRNLTAKDIEMTRCDLVVL